MQWWHYAIFIYWSVTSTALWILSPDTNKNLYGRTLLVALVFDIVFAMLFGWVIIPARAIAKAVR